MGNKKPLAQNIEEIDESGGWGEDWGNDPKLSEEELKNFDYANANLNKCTD